MISVAKSRPGKPGRLPARARAALWLDRLLSSGVQITDAFRAELLLACLTPEEIDQRTSAYYERRTAFLPEGSVYEGGLFDWESRVLASGLFPGCGRILVGGAGGGREMKALCGLGYSVTAFEPSSVLVEAAREVAAGYPGTRVVQASYRDLARAAAADPSSPVGPSSPAHPSNPAHPSSPVDPSSPLSSILANGGFDAAILGWGSLSHVIHPRDRLELLTALRRLAPAAPVLVSYLPLDQIPSGRPDRLRLWLRSSFRGPLHGFAIPGQIVHLTRGAFVYRFAPGEIEELARRAGYEVKLLVLQHYPHAVLVPSLA